MEPCVIARDLLQCETGPCLALEARDGRTVCGLVRNPLAYLFKAQHPEIEVPCLEDPPPSPEGNQISVQIAYALGLGKGCDADDDDCSAAWPFHGAASTSG